MNNPAYVIIHVNVTDATQYDKYRVLSSQAMAEHGAQVLVRGGEQVVLEGEFYPRTVVLKFASRAQAQAFYDSPTYQAARELRKDASVADFMIVEGCEVSSL
ncbi:MAG: DUF1330 domain-containing protein [Formosimonas sp.]